MKRRTISLPEELLNEGIKKAEEDNRNFSSYLQSLIQKDLEGRLPVPANRKPQPAKQEEAVA